MTNSEAILVKFVRQRKGIRREDVTEEQTFFNEGDVLVTRSRIVIGKQTYPMNGITSIRTETVQPNLILPFIPGLMGVIMSLAVFGGGFGYLFIGLLLLGIAVAWWKAAKPVYNILFGTAVGEKQALTNPNAEYVSRVEDAINEALIARA